MATTWVTTLPEWRPNEAVDVVVLDSASWSDGTGCDLHERCERFDRSTGERSGVELSEHELDVAARIAARNPGNALRTIEHLAELGLETHGDPRRALRRVRDLAAQTLANIEDGREAVTRRTEREGREDAKGEG